MKAFFVAAVLAVATLFGAGQSMAAGTVHKLAIHVDEDDPAVWSLALNNVENARQYFESKGEEVKIEVVAYGPGLKMLFAGDKNPVKDRIAAMSLQTPDNSFSACAVTLGKMEQKAGHKIELLSEANVVPGGVIRLMELQGEGYAYLKP